MAFWKKIFKSKYTGAEIDAAVAKANTVPAVTPENYGDVLSVDTNGNIVATPNFKRGVWSLSNFANQQIFTLLQEALPDAISTGSAHVHYTVTADDDANSYNAIDDLITDLTDDGTVNEVLIVTGLEYPVNLSFTTTGDASLVVLAGVSAIMINIVCFSATVIITPGSDEFSIDMFFKSVS